jgi:hypothetical protein
MPDPGRGHHTRSTHSPTHSPTQCPGKATQGCSVFSIKEPEPKSSRRCGRKLTHVTGHIGDRVHPHQSQHDLAAGGQYLRHLSGSTLTPICSQCDNQTPVSRMFNSPMLSRNAGILRRKHVNGDTKKDFRVRMRKNEQGDLANLRFHQRFLIKGRVKPRLLRPDSSPHLTR